MRQRTFLGIVVVVAVAAMLVIWGFRRTATYQDSSELVSLGDSPGAVSTGTERQADRPSAAQRSEGVRLDEVRAFESVTITVTDELYQALEGAEVFAETEDRVAFLGDTTDGGRLVIARSRVVDGWVSARVSGFVPGFVAVPDSSVDAVELVLRPGGRLRGCVRWPDRTPVGSGYYVYTVSGRVGEQVFRKVLRGCVRPGIRSAQTNAEGEFILEGLDSAVPVQVYAAGPGGWMSRATSAAPGEYLDLIVRPVYGVRVHLMEEGGAKLQTSSRLRGFSRSWRCDDPSVETCNYSLDATVRAIIAEDWIEGVWRHVGDDHLLFLFQSKPGIETVGPAPGNVEPVFVSFAIPGYAPKKVETRARRIDGEVLDVDIELRPVADGWGVLVAHIDGVIEGPIESQRPRAGKRFGVLKLENVETGATVGAAVVHPIEQPLRIEGVPYGYYRVFLLTTVGGTRVPPHGRSLLVEIGPEATECHLLLSGYGGVDVQLSRQEGTPYEGPASFMVIDDIQEDFFVGEEVLFQEAPYFIEGLEPRIYTIRVQRSGDQQARGSFPESEVTVVADRISTCRIVLPQ